MWNESFEFFTRKMPKSKESWDYGSVSGTAAVKDKELVTFSLFISKSFPLLFFTILDSGRQNY